MSKHSCVPNTVELDGSAFSDADDEATAFNNYFASVFNDDLSLPNSLPSAPFTDELLEVDVLSAVNLLNPTKTLGTDNLHAKILKECAEGLVPSLCNLFNQSFRRGRLPREWNCATLHKKGPKTDVTNYRQTSEAFAASIVSSKGIYINENLTSFRRELLKEANKKRKNNIISSACTIGLVLLV